MSMLRKLKEQVNKAVNELKEPEHHSAEEAGGSTGYVQIGEDAQGFLCPVCMTTFEAPDDLQRHFATAHAQPPAYAGRDFADAADGGSEGERNSRSSSISEENNQAVGSFICPQCFVAQVDAEALQQHYRSQHETLSDNGDGSLLAVRFEMKDLRAKIQEEQWYSSELKKELDRLQYEIQTKGADLAVSGGNESAYLLQQIQVLEAGKAMVTQRMLEFEKECGTLKRANEALQREKDQVLEKSALMAKDVVQMKSQLDEENSQKQALGEDLLKLKDIVASLEKQLDQRPSEDDVAVLRRELVHAQTLMDTITQEKELEIAQLTGHNDQLRLQNEQNRSAIDLLSKQLSEAPKNDDLIKLESSLKELSDFTEELKSQSSENVGFLEEISKLKADVELGRDQVSATRKEIELVKESSAKMAEKVESANKDLQENVKELEQLKITVAEKEAKIRELETQMALKASEIMGMEQTAEKSRDEIKERDLKIAQLEAQLQQANKESTERLTTLEDVAAQREELQKRLDEEVTNAERALSKCQSLDHEKQEMQRQIEKRDVVFREKENCENQLKQQIVSLQTSAKDMLSKIEEGEGTETAIAQLSAEKSTLSDQIIQLNERSDNQKIQFEITIDQLHQQIKEKSIELDTANSERTKVLRKCEQLTIEMGKVNDKNAAVDSQVKIKNERLLEMEKEKDAQRAEFEAHFQQLRSSASERKSKLLQLSKENESLVIELDGKRDELKSADCALQQEKGKLQEAIEKLEAVQRKAEERANELEEAQAIRVALEANGQQLDANLADAAGRIAQLQTELAQAIDIQSKGEKTWNDEKKALESALERSRDEIEALKITVKTHEANFDENQENWKMKVQKWRTEKEQVINLMTEKADLSKQTIEELQSKSNNLDKIVQDLKNSTGLLETENNRLKRDLESKDLELSSLQEKMQELERNWMENKSFADVLVQEKSKCEQEMLEKTMVLDRQDALIRELETKLAMSTEETDKQSQQSLERLESLQTELKEKIIENQSLQEMVQQCRQDAKTASDAESMAKEQISIIQTQLDTVSDNLNKKEAALVERDELYEELLASKLNLENRLENKESQLQTIDNTMLQREQDWKQRENSIETEKSALMERISKAEEDAVQARQETIRYQEAAKSLKTDFNDRIELVNKELETEKETRKMENHENENRLKTMQLEMDKLRNDVTEMETQAENSKTQMDRLRENNAQLECDKNDFDVQLNAWQDEKRALLERCLKTESDQDFERERAMENKRRFEEALAAMHELGRANQSLQIDMSKQFNRKWLDDSEAFNCTACGKQFTLTIRKHHCRNCGLIFCNECTSKTAQVPSCKKPARVCDNCDDELAAR